MGDVCTLRQFIDECQNFKYSKEYMEMCVEHFQITMGERYLESQQYLSEHSELLESSPGYYCERLNDNSFVNYSFVKDNFVKRAVKLLIRLLTKLKNAVVVLWKKVFSKKNKDLEKSIKDLINDNANTSANFIHAKAVIDKAEEIINKYPYVKGMKLTEIRDLGYNSNLTRERKYNFYYVMTLAFDDVLTIKRHIDDNPDLFIITVNEYDDLFNTLVKDENASSFKRKYESMRNNNGSIQFSVEDNTFKQFANTLTENIESLSNMQSGNSINLSFNNVDMEAMEMFNSFTGLLLEMLTELGRCRAELTVALRDALEYGDTIHRFHPTEFKPEQFEPGDKKSELHDFNKVNISD